MLILYIILLKYDKNIHKTDVLNVITMSFMLKETTQLYVNNSSLKCNAGR